MDDLLYLAVLVGCMAVTLGLVRLCAVLMPAKTQEAGSKP
jgi:hypothetical protein